MLPDMMPASLLTLLSVFSPRFTAPSFRTFTGLACGFLAQGEPGGLRDAGRGRPEVTSGQLRYLAEVGASCPRVSIRILPFAAGEHASRGAGFSVLRFSQVPSFGLIHIDGPGDGGLHRHPRPPSPHTPPTFMHMQLFSLTIEEAAARLVNRSLASEA